MKDLNKDNKSMRRKLFDFNKDGKGVSKSEGELPPGLKRFFICFWNHIGKLLSANIIMVVGNFPLFFIIIALAGYTQRGLFLPLSDLYQNLLGSFSAGSATGPLDMSIFALEGMMHQTVAPTVWTYIFFGIGALTLFTFGPINTGTAYIFRNMVSGEPVFVWADFKYAVKRNLKQGMLFGIIDCLICIILGFNIFSMLQGTDEFFGSFMFWANVVMFVLYFTMRFYVYVQIVTFDLSIFKIIKNSLIFSLLGVKRNVLALLGNALILGLEVFFLLGAGGLLLPFAVALPFILMLSTCSLMKVYASYFKIKQYMIDPYLAEHPEDAPVYEDEPIMLDDVTERERLEETKRRNGIE